nr:hypothetical protein [Tanacetum cinerariifolium]
LRLKPQGGEGRAGKKRHRYRQGARPRALAQQPAPLLRVPKRCEIKNSRLPAPGVSMDCPLMTRVPLKVATVSSRRRLSLVRWLSCCNRSCCAWAGAAPNTSAAPRASRPNFIFTDITSSRLREWVAGQRHRHVHRFGDVAAYQQRNLDMVVGGLHHKLGIHQQVVGSQL